MVASQHNAARPRTVEHCLDEEKNPNKLNGRSRMHHDPDRWVAEVEDSSVEHCHWRPWIHRGYPCLTSVHVGSAPLIQPVVKC